MGSGFGINGAIYLLMSTAYEKKRWSRIMFMTGLTKGKQNGVRNPKYCQFVYFFLVYTFNYNQFVVTDITIGALGYTTT